MIAVIGGTSGIGLTTASYLQQEGYDVLVGGRRQLDNNHGLTSHCIDVSNESSIIKFFSSIQQLDGLIYATGITKTKCSITEFDVADWSNIISTNVTGLLLCLKHAYELLKQSKGRIVVVNSVAARTFSKFSGIEYTASKASLCGVVKQLSIDFARDQVLINSVFPSMTATPMLRENVEEDLLRSIESEIPLGRIAEPLEIAQGIEFLISRKNTYMTGCGLDLNGGQFLNG